MFISQAIQGSLMDDFLLIIGIEDLPSAYYPLAMILCCILLFYLIFYLVKVFLVLVGVNR